MSLDERYPELEIPNPTSEELQAEIEHGIQEKFEFMKSLVEGYAANRERSPKRIATVQNNLKGTENYYMHSAIYRLLDSKGLLDSYFMDESAFSETENGWEVIVSVPLAGTKFREQFRFVSRETALPDEHGATHRFTLWYQLRTD